MKYIRECRFSFTQILPYEDRYGEWPLNGENDVENKKYFEGYRIIQKDN